MMGSPQPAGRPGELAYEFFAMGTPCRIAIEDTPEDVAERAARAAIAEIRRIEAKYSRYQGDSVVSRINAAAGGARAVEVDDETADLLDFAARLHAFSDGLFDPTTGVLRKVWDFRAARVPEPEEVEAALACVGWQRVEWLRPHIRLEVPGMELDFGGFGKEYAVDRAASTLADAGAASALVNLGGDLRVVGRRASGQGWLLGIADPRRVGAVFASMTLHEGALATSGDYERYFEHAGRRYCHVLDPRSGWPAQGWRSVSVSAPACLAAGAISTIAMLKGEHALGFLRGEAVDFLAVDSEGATFHEGRLGEGRDRGD
jgi:thiamine biosynthesis lipoprotein